MEERSVAEETSQPETSRDVRPEQPENMEERSVAEDTSQPETSRDFRPEQPENMSQRFVALLTSSFARSILLQFESPLNNLDPSKTAI